MTEGDSKRPTWRTLMLYLLVTPAALQVLVRLDEYLEFSALIGRLLRAWRDFVHGLWADFLAALRAWLDLDLTANQVDVLSWMALMLGAAGTSAAFGPPKEVLRASCLQAAVFFWSAFLIVAALFVQPHLATIGYFFQVAWDRDGWLKLLLGVAVTLACIFVGASHVVSKIVEARAARAGALDLPPLWSDIEALVGPFLAGALIGGVIALPALESEASVDRVAADVETGVAALRNLAAPTQWLALVLMGLFMLSLVFLRRYNWPTMPRQVAAAVGIMLADRLIGWGAPALQELRAWLAL